MSSNTYFAADEADKAVGVLLDKAQAWQSNMISNGYLEKLKTCWRFYHGAYYTNVSDGHQITFGGTQEELVNLPVNHVRNLAEHIIVMTTANRPVMEARAVNTDYKSLVQTHLANGLLDYYMREKRLEKFLKKAVESAVVLGGGYIKVGWNQTTGEIYEYNQETNTPIYEGDLEFQNYSPFDVIVDSSKENESHDWYLCRGWKNKYDIIAKYPELQSEIEGLPTRSQLDRFQINFFGNENTDDIPIYEFYHKRTESLPDGRYILFLDKAVVLYDGPMPYRNIPIFRMSPADIMGTPYGYASIFDLLPLQEAINSLYSTILTNQNAFGVQNVLVPRGSDISIKQLSGGLNIIEANITATGAKPEALNLTDTPAEIFKMVDLLRQEMETLSGVNSVSRGQPEASLKSGAALALVQSMAIQFMSGLQGSYVALVEDVGSAIINTLKDYAAVPRVAAIAGKTNRVYMKEFKGEDLSSISRVVVDIGNPLARTTAGRVQMAEQLLQMGLLKNPQQYLTIINTGKLDVAFEGEQNELLLIKRENELMLNGEPVPVLDIDTHKEHIIEHKAVLYDPELRKNPELVQNVLSHIQEHINSLRQADPALLGLLDQQSLQEPPQAPTPSDQLQPPQQGMAGATPVPGQDVIKGPGIEQGVGLPKLPQPSPPFQNMPTNPSQAIQ